jgi:thiosulfate dehydrogenase (quinone) large subunit
MMNTPMIIKIFLRLALAAGFFSAVADRLGWWPSGAAWGNWASFLDYTKVINPWFPPSIIPAVGLIATVAEVVFAIALLIGFKTEWFAKASGLLLLTFGLAMTFSVGIKAPLDYSVFNASAAAFALSTFKAKYFELDVLLVRK